MLSSWRLGASDVDSLPSWQLCQEKAESEILSEFTFEEEHFFSLPSMLLSSNVFKFRVNDLKMYHLATAAETFL
jgi:hypothetical protein